MLTQKSAEKLKGKNNRTEKPAGVIPGLYLVVQPSGAKSWGLRYRANGKTVKLTLGQFQVELYRTIFRATRGRWGCLFVSLLPTSA